MIIAYEAKKDIVKNKGRGKEQQPSEVGCRCFKYITVCS